MLENSQDWTISSEAPILENVQRLERKLVGHQVGPKWEALARVKI